RSLRRSATRLLWQTPPCSTGSCRWCDTVIASARRVRSNRGNRGAVAVGVCVANSTLFAGLPGMDCHVAALLEMTVGWGRESSLRAAGKSS
ncbi:MAG: hypothetical protein LBF83_09230, partial [Spirochaetaceae bacterium]|nr:hypothetical protein [Spirochaetaceae bacterium]